jgi:hypothetical protein
MRRRDFLAQATAAAAVASLGALALPGPTRAFDPVHPAVTGLAQLDGPYDLVFRGACVRLGVGGPKLHINAVHGSLGVTRVGLSSVGDLVVYTDFAPPEFLIVAAANIDFQLGAKGVTCGVSGGGPKSTIRLVDGHGVRRRANSSYFDIAVDNIWFQTLSIRPR